MTSISIHKEIVPINAIILHDDSCKPTGYANETALFGKYVKATPTAGTNPGCAIGCTTHTHNASGAHTHTGNAPCHTHTGLADGGISTFTTLGGGGSTIGNHSHTFVSDGKAPTVTANSQGDFTHAALTNEMDHKTQFFLKHNESSIGLRRKNLGQNSIFMWGKSSGLPSRFSIDCNLNNKHIKGVPASCSTPNADLGSNCHTHNAHACHTHTMTLPAHCHDFTGTTSTQGTPANFSSSTIILMTQTSHNHAGGTINLDNSSAACALSSEGSIATSHPCQSNEAEFKTINFIKQTSIGLRMHGIIPGGMVFWNTVVACLPSNFQVGDGTNGTTTMLSKYPKGTTGSPGTTGGCNTHTHATGGGCHLHSGSGIAHTHPTSGSSGSGGGAGPAKSSVGANAFATSHTHTSTTASGSTSPSSSLLDNTDTHTHDSQNNRPPSILVSIIERLTA